MAKSKIQFQKGYSLFEFLKDYGTEAQCENALFTWRFPNGFVCPECANKTCLSPEKAATCVAMQSLPSPDVIDWKYDFRKHQAPTDQVVSGNAPVVTNQNRLVSDGAKAPVGRQI